MPIINRLPINLDNDNEHYEALVNRQAKSYKKYDTARNYDLFSIGYTVAVQQGDGGPWTHGTVIGRGDHKHINRSYAIRVTKQATQSPETANISKQHPSQLNNTSGTNSIGIQKILWTKYQCNMKYSPHIMCQIILRLEGGRKHI